MATFNEAVIALLDYVNRPYDELNVQAAREIDNVLLWLQRQHEFKYSERLIKVVYPANTVSVTLDTLLSAEVYAALGKPRNWLSFQTLATANDNSGSLLELTSYNQIQQERRAYQTKFNAPNSEYTHEEFTSDVHVSRVFLANEGFGLYPTPTVEVNVLINLHVFLPTVTGTGTNFLLDSGYDFVLDKALSRMNMYLKEDARVAVSEEQMAKDFEALIQWDSQIRRSTNG